MLVKGKMAKENRAQTERPAQLTWAQITEDLGMAREDDVAFQIGQESVLSKPVCESPAKPPASPTSPHSPAPSGGGDHPDDIRTSCDNVSRLLHLFKELKETPASLQEQHDRLKLLSQDMCSSIEELKTLSQTLVGKNKSEHSQGQKVLKSSPGQETSSNSSKGKTKHKKKK